MTPAPDAPEPAGAAKGDVGVITKTSPRSVGETVARLLELLASKGVKVFVVIDQRAEALAVGLDLRETTLVVFGNPAAGTGVMEAAPLAALDLPLKALVWSGSNGVTQVSYTDPSVLAARYGLDADLVAGLEVIHGLTDVLVAG
ncbi:MAG: DUF302 domain-containing protein [Acidimicrobiales bacterium]